MDHHHHAHSSNHTNHHHSAVSAATSSVSTQHHAHAHDDHSMSAMVFHAGSVETILFESWMTPSVPLFIISWIFIFIMGILYAGIQELRQFSEEERFERQPIFSDDAIENELARMNTESLPSTVRSTNKMPFFYSERLLHSALYIVHLALGYSLMLIAMTFNVYLFFAIVFGVGTGHLLFTCTRVTSSTNKRPRHL